MSPVVMQRMAPLVLLESAACLAVADSLKKLLGERRCFCSLQLA